jgi:hypothetical protein
MNRETLKRAQKEMRQRMQKQPSTRRQTRDAEPAARPYGDSCLVPHEWRYTLTIALRALVQYMHSIGNESGCKRALECARALGLDAGLVAKYTHLENVEVAHA